MSGWDKFVETFFNAKVMVKYLPDILSGVVVTIELALLIVVTGLGPGLRWRCCAAWPSGRSTG